MPFQISSFSTDIGVDILNPKVKLKNMTIDGDSQTIHATFAVYANDSAEIAKKSAGHIHIFIGPTPTTLVPAVMNDAGQVVTPAVVIPSYHFLTRDNPATASLFNAVIQAAESIAILYPQLAGATQLPLS